VGPRFGPECIPDELAKADSVYPSRWQRKLNHAKRVVVESDQCERSFIATSLSIIGWRDVGEGEPDFKLQYLDRRERLTDR
jgi:hypothetical protein